ncbi:MAG: zinc finger domain-containing protein [Terriglobales bacterium]
MIGKAVGMVLAVPVLAVASIPSAQASQHIGAWSEFGALFVGALLCRWLRTRSENRIRKLQPCPKCGAAAGSPCLDGSGRVESTTHRERDRAYNQHQRAYEKAKGQAWKAAHPRLTRLRPYIYSVWGFTVALAIALMVWAIAIGGKQPAQAAAIKQPVQTAATAPHSGESLITFEGKLYYVPTANLAKAERLGARVVQIGEGRPDRAAGLGVGGKKPAQAAAEGRIEQRNKRTGAFRYSTDGGKTWHPGRLP